MYSANTAHCHDLGRDGAGILPGVGAYDTSDPNGVRTNQISTRRGAGSSRALARMSGARGCRVAGLVADPEVPFFVHVSRWLGPNGPSCRGRGVGVEPDALEAEGGGEGGR